MKMDIKFSSKTNSDSRDISSGKVSSLISDYDNYDNNYENRNDKMQNTMLNLRKFGKQIKKYRIIQNLRQKDLADLTGLSLNTISRLEQGVIGCSLDNLIVLSNALKISPDMLLFGNFNPEYSSHHDYFIEMTGLIIEKVGNSVESALKELLMNKESIEKSPLYQLDNERLRSVAEPEIEFLSKKRIRKH